MSSNTEQLSPLAARGLELYRERLQALLEPEHSGESVAIHVDTGDYELGGTHSDAARRLLSRHDCDGRIVTLTIGPPTDRDIRMSHRLAGARKQ
jgi:hypothetical protein